MKKQIEIARAKLKVYQEVEEFEDDMDSVEVDLWDTAPIQIELETKVRSLPSPKDPSIRDQYRIQILQIQPRSSLKSISTSIHFP